MDPIEILEKIIEEKGSCNWIRQPGIEDTRDICNNCPLNTGETTCLEFVTKLCDSGKHGAAIHDKAYYKEAERLLTKIAVEDMLKGKYDE